jgi:AcrR family transcriptional regulator
MTSLDSTPSFEIAEAATNGALASTHNLNGQKLGRKGRDTRDRIIVAAQTLLADPQSPALTLSAVARVASLRMTSLYNYFSDLTELLLALLEPVMAEAEAAYVSKLRIHWPDDALNPHCLNYVQAFYDFWARNARLLHLRNSLADNRDDRMARQRVLAATPVIELFVTQMGKDPATLRTGAFGMATVLYTGIERVVTVATDVSMQSLLQGNFLQNIEHYLQSEARLLELGIRDYRDSGET